MIEKERIGIKLIGEMLERVAELRERVERAIKAYDAIVYVEELNATAKRIEREYGEAVERERNRKIGSSVGRLGLGVAGHLFGSRELLVASFREEECGIVRIAEKNGEFEVINLSEMAREEGTTTDFLIPSYTLKGYRLMDIDSFRERIEELKAKASSGFWGDKKLNTHLWSSWLLL